MKNCYLLIIIIGFVLGLDSCKKGNNDNTYPVVGKWQQTELRTYADSLGIIVHDTTYYKPFTDSDFVQFKSNNTCSLVQDHYYYNTGYGYPKTPQKIPAIVNHMNYTYVGGKYVLNTQSTLVNPGGFVTADTVTLLTSNTLLLHTVFYAHSPGYTSVVDSYYKR